MGDVLQCICFSKFLKQIVGKGNVLFQLQNKSGSNTTVKVILVNQIYQFHTVLLDLIFACIK